MLVCRTIKEIRDFVHQARSRGLSVGFVPTMGYFHEGHLTLMRRAKEACDVVVVSIFVNPLQFGPREDYDRYPRDLDRDVSLAREVGVDAIFHPSVEEMYPPGFATHVDVEGLTGCLCGLSRPGHFRGVATVVTKLFNIVRPDRAFFGQKDAQQALVIRRMVEDLNMDLEIVTVPTVREDDGLAMSSRNVYLSPEERRAATVLPRSLEAARRAYEAGERDADRLVELVRSMIAAEPRAEIDYVDLRSVPDLQPVSRLEGPALLALAVRFGCTRLIDNVVLGSPDGVL
ncbi:pantoate--beta-alanine ligase [Desulfofundulus australicus DSM 11792]|uniref:Pantothenate synthetase n=1 Tax=Desulfofundulus australicus DSM 11792 TaxID=1121425 RepID=A0A1M4WKR2_9FIRM|nr:pantoate--beta-alanine ligase [Desulfofundulus australicus]SHE81643.1 pantoate--beta-alanine ligase [Desulfofundulus australicus DSM 11792]